MKTVREPLKYKTTIFVKTKQNVSILNFSFTEFRSVAISLSPTINRLFRRCTRFPRSDPLERQSKCYHRTRTTMMELSYYRVFVWRTLFSCTLLGFYLRYDRNPVRVYTPDMISSLEHYLKSTSRSTSFRKKRPWPFRMPVWDSAATAEHFISNDTEQRRCVLYCTRVDTVFCIFLSGAPLPDVPRTVFVYALLIQRLANILRKQFHRRRVSRRFTISNARAKKKKLLVSNVYDALLYFILFPPEQISPTVFSHNCSSGSCS